MILGIVKGSAQATVKHAILEGEKLLLVQPVDNAGRDNGPLIVALDRVQAGLGDRVLVADEGNSARVILDNPTAPMRTVILALVDQVDLA